ncbi:MAG TPA: LysE family transporter [Candidatus Lumbricidophila sp.]|nr:LysE family transporter [Candidatus Lumbricidophila sp.]
MPFPLWATLLVASLVLSAVPGAGAVYTMRNSLTVGWRRTIWGVLGLQSALAVHITIVAAGVGLLVVNSPVLLEAIRYAGAAYLGYLGVRQILRRPEISGDETVPPVNESPFSLWLRGLGVNLLNPKSIVFYLAFIPPFLRPESPMLPQYLIIGATTIVVDTVVMQFGYASIARPFRAFAHTVRGQRVMNGTFGGLFIAVALLLVFIHE